MFGSSFQFPFNVANHMLNIVQYGDTFDLRVDNQSFQHIYNLEKQKNEFKYDAGLNEPKK